MQNSIQNTLLNAKLDFSTYANLPIHEDIVLIKEINNNDEVLKLWDKLNYLRKNLKILDRYIETNKGEKLKDWLVTDKSGMAPAVMDKVGNHNNLTGGITSYFYNLQNFYDEQEELYDALELTLKIPHDIKPGLKRMADEREQKRKNRRVTRKLHLKDLKTDDLGYLLVEIEPEPELQLNADGDGTQPGVNPNKNPNNPTDDKVVEVVKNRSGKIIVWVAGIGIAVAAVYGITKGTKE